MRKLFAPLKTKDIVTLFVLIAIGFGWLLVDQIFLPASRQRFFAFTIIILGLYFIQYQINKPIKLLPYINSIALVTISFTVVVSVIMHVILRNDFSYKSLLIWLISGIVPYLSGFLYSKTTIK